MIYFCANLGLALQSSYPALLTLRMLQSTGSSGTIAIGTGVVADIATSGERGVWMGAALMGPMVTWHSKASFYSLSNQLIRSVQLLHQ